MAFQLLVGAEVLLVSRMGVVAAAFRRFDKDGSGRLSLGELRAALVSTSISRLQCACCVACELLLLHANSYVHLVPSDSHSQALLRIELTEGEFLMTIDRFDDDRTGHLTLTEFTKLAAGLRLPIGRVKRTRLILLISAAALLMQLALGTLALHALEDSWDLLDALYFGILSLTTVGVSAGALPTSAAAAIFSYFYCVFGLALVFVLVASITAYCEAHTQVRATGNRAPRISESSPAPPPTPPQPWFGSETLVARKFQERQLELVDGASSSSSSTRAVPGINHPISERSGHRTELGT
jgi:hypothetical protein